ncbi:NADH-quinone oxidoreductase subunit J [Moraxella oblonga]|uniref:NADH-quinone oxidoreductase subunit J n=1 Tax=Moraxella oblonga TaxID=200413 RepID=UPI00082C4B0A|nr:NADH-quinone oxidoreductase subunit J [Moraxella oblonga]
MIDLLNKVLGNGDAVGFYVLGLVAIFASLRTVTHANPVHAILSLIVSLLAVAGIFFILGAPFAGMLEMIVYAGAILVLFVFVIMMLNLGQDTSQEKAWLSASAWATPVCLTLIIGAVMVGLLIPTGEFGQTVYLQDTGVSAKEVGIALFGQYVLIVEMAAFLLLGALVAAYHLGKKALDDENESHTQELAEEGGV